MSLASVGRALIAAIMIVGMAMLGGCTRTTAGGTDPPLPRVTVEGQLADYTWSQADGLQVRPKIGLPPPKTY